MARRHARPRAAVRKAAARALEAARSTSEPQVIADGVRSIAVQLEPVVTPGSLYWTAPTHYVAGQMAPRLCAHYKIDPARVDDVAEYIVAAMNEFVVSLVERFDEEHFEAWIAAAFAAGERKGVVRG